VNRTAGGVSCKSQESELAVLWTLGIFALNFGPVLVGPVLDGLGPKWTAVLGEIKSCGSSHLVGIPNDYRPTICILVISRTIWLSPRYVVPQQRYPMHPHAPAQAAFSTCCV
jgi:hypothetical protein